MLSGEDISKVRLRLRFSSAILRIVSNGQSLLSYLSLLQHHESLLEGVFDSSDIAYYLLLITGFLGLTIRQLDRERLL
jgi:ABC-2 type transport system permease protein